MNKKEIQQRVLQNRKPLALSKFEWDEKALVFSSTENYLVLDFTGINHCTFKTGFDCTFTTGDGCTFTTEYGCTFKTGSDCTFTTWCDCVFTTGCGCTFTTWSDCVIVRKNLFEVIQPKEGEVIQICPNGIKGHLVNGKLNGVPHIIADGILSEIISEKKGVYKVINHGETKQSYLIKKGGVYSHGKTLKEAKDSLIYKISDRDTSKYEDLTLDSTLTKEDMIQCYMTITGACSEGTKYFVNNNEDIKDKYSIREIVELTRGQYGNKEFEEFFNDK